MARRPTLSAVVSWTVAAVVPFVAGCHDGGVGNLAPRPEPNLPKVSVTAAEAIRKHNINASHVQALEAKPRITIASAEMNGSVDGRIALERPHSFKLEMFGPGLKRPVADIGSNETGFWFWTKNDRDRSVYVCSFDEIDKTPLSSAFQPDWIIESMGLQAISREEADQITSKPGDVYGTTKLISVRRGARGEKLTKETVIDQDGRIREHRLFEGDRKTLVAQAVVSDYQKLSSVDQPEVVVFLPYKVKLTWIPQKLSLDIQLDSTKLRQAFTDDRRHAIFVVPTIPGTKQVNLAEYQAPVGTDAPARAAVEPSNSRRTRSTRPAPTPGPGVDLGNPEPFGIEGTSRGPHDPLAFSADRDAQSLRRAADRVVRPGIPRPGQE